MKIFRTYTFWIILASLMITGWLLWFLFTSHSAPSYSRYIPKNAIGVLTLNTKRLGADLLFGGEIKKDSSAAATKFYSKWKKASDENGGLGISLSSDILVFTVLQESKKMYSGLIIKLDDEKKFLSFISTQIPKLLDSSEYQFLPIRTGKFCKFFQIGRGSAFEFYPPTIAFNEEVAILYLGYDYHSELGAEGNMNELDKLFSMKKENSILSNENFISSQKHAADISFYFDYNQPLLRNYFTQNKGDSLYLPGYFNAWLDFSKGDIALEMLTVSSSPSHAPVFRKNNAGTDFLKFTDREKFLALFHLNIDMQNLMKNFTAKEKNEKLVHFFEQLSLSTEDVESCFGGEADLVVNDFISYKKKIIEYEYDENYNRKTVEQFKEEYIPGFTIRVAVDASKAMSKVLPRLLSDKSIIAWKTGYKFNSDIPVYIYPAGQYIFISTDENMPMDKKSGAVKNDELRELLAKHSSVAFADILAIEKSIEKRSGKNNDERIKGKMESLSMTTDEEPGGITKALIHAHLSDKKTNSLIQILELIQKQIKNKHY